MKGTPLTDKTFDYIVDLFAIEESQLLELMQRRASEKGVPMIMISEEQARFVGFFLKAMNAKRVLDIGTLFGYSAVIMSRAIGAEGEVVTLEFEPLHATVARENFKHLNIENIKILQGPALEQMKGMPDNYFDFIMIDADKPNYVNYLREALRLIRNGGVIAGDNALAWGKIAEKNIPANDPDFLSATAMQLFNAEFAALKNVFSCIVPVGDGMAMGVVQK